MSQLVISKENKMEQQLISGIFTFATAEYFLTLISMQKSLLNEKVQRIEICRTILIQPDKKDYAIAEKTAEYY